MFAPSVRRRLIAAEAGSKELIVATRDARVLTARPRHAEEGRRWPSASGAMERSRSELSGAMRATSRAQRTAEERHRPLQVARGVSVEIKVPEYLLHSPIFFFARCARVFFFEKEGNFFLRRAPRAVLGVFSIGKQ